jgi:hypothetical protein
MNVANGRCLKKRRLNKHLHRCNFISYGSSVRLASDRVLLAARAIPPTEFQLSAKVATLSPLEQVLRLG